MSTTNGNGTKPPPETELPPDAIAAPKFDLESDEPIAQLPAASPTRSTGGSFGKKLVIFGVTGMGVLLLMRSCSSRVQPPAAIVLPPGMPQPSQTATPTPSTEPTPDAPRPDPASVQRSALLGESTTEAQAVADQLLCARTEYFLMQATQELAAKGTPIADSLTAKLQQVNAKNQQATARRPAFDGSPDTIAQARSLNLDTLALLKAIEMTDNSTPLTLCSVTPAKAILSISQFTDTAILLQSRSAIERLQSQQAKPADAEVIP